MIARLPLFILLFLLVCSLQAVAQMAADDSLPTANLVKQYTQNRGESLLLYNGIEYARSYPHTTGHPFFLTDSFSIGQLVYDGVLYQNIPLNYNITANCVVIKNRNGFLIELVNEKVGSFATNNHFFISLSSADITKETMQPGIYELYQYNPAAVFIRHEKVVQQAGNAADPDHFTKYDYYFIKKGDAFFVIKSNNDLLPVFSDRTSELKTYLHQNHLNFKKHPEETLLKAAAYYAQLKK